MIMATFADLEFAKEWSRETDRIKKQIAQNEKIRNFNKTLGTIFNLVAAATEQPWLAAGGSVTKWLNPEKKYKKGLLRTDIVKDLNRERRGNMPSWYDPFIDVAIAYLGSEAAAKVDWGGKFKEFWNKGLGKMYQAPDLPIGPANEALANSSFNFNNSPTRDWTANYLSTILG